MTGKTEGRKFSDLYRKNRPSTYYYKLLFAALRANMLLPKKEGGKHYEENRFTVQPAVF